MQWNALAHDLAWPITVLVALFVLRERLPDLIGRLKRVKAGNTELEFVSKEANTTLAAAAHSGHLSDINVDAVFESVRLNEWATLVLSRMLMRKGLASLAKNFHNLGNNPSLTQLMSVCKDNRVIPAELVQDLERLREVTYFAEWWAGRVPPKDEWAWAVSNSKRIIKALFDRQPVA